MGMMGQMRSLASWFILTVGGLFVLFMVLSDSNIASYFGQQRNYVGSINGKDISYQEFSQALENARAYQQQQGQEIDESQMPIFRDQVWDAIVMQTLLTEKMEEFDITVTDDEIRDVLLGPNPPADIRQNFIDSTGNFNRAMYESALFDPQNKAILVQIEDRIRQEKMQTKLQSLLFGSISASDEEVKRRFQEQNTQISAEFVFVNSTIIPDTNIQVSDSEIENYYNAHKEDYKVDELRKIKYVLFKKQPSKADSNAVLSDLAAILRDLKADTSSFKTFAQIYSEEPYSVDTLNLRVLPEAAKDLLVKANAGELVGPVLNNGSYTVYKLVAKRKTTEPLVKASHILVNGTDDAAKTKADAIYKELMSGADFELLAAEKSDDKGSAVRGGDVGWFGKGQMVPEFTEACYSGKIGVIQKPVKSQYGYHIIKVTDKNDQEFVIEKITKKIIASGTTMDNRYNAAGDFAYVAEEYDFESEAEQAKYEVIESYGFDEKAKTIAGLGQNEALVKFAFENSIGDISEVYNVPAGYVVATVSEITPAGYQPLKDIEGNIKQLVRTEKKFAIAKEKIMKIRDKVLSSKDLNLAKEIDPSVQVDVANNFTLAGRIPGVGNEYGFMDYSLEGKINEISQPVKGSRGYYLIKVTDRTPFDSTNYSAQKSSIRENILRMKKQRAYSQWINKVKEEADIVDNRYKFWR